MTTGKMVELGKVVQLPVEWLVPGDFQARRYFSEAEINHLATDLIEHGGNITPIVVRKKARSELYEIISGERRWRAAQKAQFSVVNAIVRDLSDKEANHWSLSENIQREDLNPIEEAEGIRDYMERWQLDQQSAAKELSVSRSSISNKLRLLNLCDDVKELVLQGELEAGAAKVLVPLKPFQQTAIAREALARGLSVREIEAKVKRLKMDLGEAIGKTTSKDHDVKRFEARLSEGIGTPVIIDHSKGGEGTIKIKYFSLDQLEGIAELIEQQKTGPKG